jgi:hypothetical protein
VPVQVERVADARVPEHGLQHLEVHAGRAEQGGGRVPQIVEAHAFLARLLVRHW